MQKIDRNSIPKSARDYIMSDIRAFLNKDAEYFWDERTEMIIERHPDGEVFRMNFSLTCERVRAIRFDMNKLI